MVNYDYVVPLHKAAQKCDVEALRRCLTPEVLAAWGCIDTRDKDIHSVLHALCSYEGPQPCREDDRNAEDVEACLQLLVDAGADLEARDSIDCTPLHVVAWSSDRLGTEATLRLTSLLLRHGADRRRVLATRRVLLIPAAAAREVRPQEGRRQEEEG